MRLTKAMLRAIHGADARGLIKANPRTIRCLVRDGVALSRGPLWPDLAMLAQMRLPFEKRPPCD